MSSNPYASPNLPTGYGPPSSNGGAGDAVRGPAIGLLIVSGGWCVVLVGGILFNIWLVMSGTAAEMPQPEALNISKETQVAVRCGFAIALLCLHAYVIYGAVCMLKLRSFGVAYAAAVISVIPCCSGCYIFGIPFGIWALTVLNRPEVKNAFR